MFSVSTDAGNKTEYTQTFKKELKNHIKLDFFPKTDKYNWFIKYITKISGIHSGGRDQPIVYSLIAFR
jgi:hypothetical protein